MPLHYVLHCAALQGHCTRGAAHPYTVAGAPWDRQDADLAGSGRGEGPVQTAVRDCKLVYTTVTVFLQLGRW